ncbi:MAG: D-alanyl-D-alanine carboxypeptidase [Lachnospiraceae bacterium]|nr:D-alanyl-D-alanine carboxypeptidase [Lachnospiraceae bacterium]MCM1240259.1 D-alanyl-D-alanine carboxypeptidase [Lachnospiraceae bacterium]
MTAHGAEQGGEDPAGDISLYATAAVLMDADSGRVLYGKNADTPMAMASTTKIMTCIQILEHADPEETLTVSAYAAGMPKVKLYIKQGEEYRVGDLLYSLMLESHNDAAVALAEHVGRKYLPEELREKPVSEYTAEESRMAVAAFAALMNAKAAELGCENTWFITPNGLDATETITLKDGSTVQKEHCTTAAELARIMAYCIGESPQKDLFLRITRTQTYGFSANGRGFSCYNHNAFLSMMDGALSGKTGFTNKAGYCYVGALEREGRTFVVALLACGWPNNKTYKWSDARELMEYGLEHYFYKSFLDEGTRFDEKLLQPIPVLNGRTDILGTAAYTGIAVADRRPLTDNGAAGSDGTGIRTDIGNEEDGPPGAAGECLGLLLREDEQIRVEYSWSKSLEAPVRRGTRVGNIRYIVDDRVYLTEDIVTTQSVERIGFDWCLEQILRRFLIGG